MKALCKTTNVQVCLNSLDTSVYSMLFMSVIFAKVYINIMKALMSFYLFVWRLNKQHVPDNMQNNKKNSGLFTSTLNYFIGVKNHQTLKM